MAAVHTSLQFEIYNFHFALPGPGPALCYTRCMIFIGPYRGTPVIRDRVERKGVHELLRDRHF
jgi:hypothetical protein